jgi:hypothetical protein
MRKLTALLALVVLALTGSAFAQTADDMILLAQKGVGEDVMLAFLEASRAPVELSVADIVKLKEAKVPDKVVVAMLHRHPAASPVVQPRSDREGQPEYPVRRAYRYNSGGDSQAPVEYQPVAQRVVEVPSTTYVYSGYPYAYYGDYYYPSYYPYYYPYYSPSLCLSFGYSRPSFHHHSFSSFPSHHFSNFHTGYSSGFGHSNFSSHGSFAAGGGGFHGRR